ncbi:hypothetical protein K443DRAFT_564128 [Laccaria amethystina LaAM-08-1]|uniref:Uncharacterized protein n=1 Tax=Laccaria amethystina LaAM-08-1 TaxID=1095629 RepID=A0A0C9X990_9AGAR|nr:hypothetical protein K443DRAFT_564128 [Laccaria amethystina LaAM-08-1]
MVNNQDFVIDNPRLFISDQDRFKVLNTLLPMVYIKLFRSTFTSVSFISLVHFQSCSNHSRIFHFPCLYRLGQSFRSNSRSCSCVFAVPVSSQLQFHPTSRWTPIIPSFQAIHLSIHLVKLIVSRTSHTTQPRIKTPTQCMQCIPSHFFPPSTLFFFSL